MLAMPVRLPEGRHTYRPPCPTDLSAEGSENFVLGLTGGFLRHCRHVELFLIRPAW